MPAPPVVLLPGIGGDGARDFVFLEPMLARHRRVVSVSYPSATTLAAMVERTREVIAATFSGEEVQLVGNGLGAAVALQLASLSPVKAVVLIAGTHSPGVRAGLFDATWQRLSPDRDALADFARFAAFSGPFLGLNTGAAGTAAANTAATLPWDVGVAGVATDAHVGLVASTPLMREAEQLRAPTLVIGGASDTIVGQDQSRALFGAIDNARSVSLTTGYAVLAERPAEVLSFVDPFLADPLRHPAGSILRTDRV